MKRCTKCNNDKWTICSSIYCIYYRLNWAFFGREFCSLSKRTFSLFLVPKKIENHVKQCLIIISISLNTMFIQFVVKIFIFKFDIIYMLHVNIKILTYSYIIYFKKIILNFLFTWFFFISLQPLPPKVTLNLFWISNVSQIKNLSWKKG